MQRLELRHTSVEVVTRCGVACAGWLSEPAHAPPTNFYYYYFFFWREGGNLCPEELHPRPWSAFPRCRPHEQLDISALALPAGQAAPPGWEQGTSVTHLQLAGNVLLVR